LREVAQAWCVLFLVFATLVVPLKIGVGSHRTVLVLFFAFALAGVALLRLALHFTWSNSSPSKNLLGPRIVILEEEGRAELDVNAQAMEQAGYVVARVFTIPGGDQPGEADEAARAVVRSLIQHVRQFQIDEIFVIMRWARVLRMRESFAALKMVPLPIRLIPDEELSWFLDRVSTEASPSRNVVLQRAPLSALEHAVKRAFDVSVAAAALVALAPVLALAALAIAAETEGPVLFWQWRGGYNHHCFRICKFRTMTALEDGANVRQAVQGDARVTRVGRILRKFSLDELPQLYNVLVGDMSLVGPRPHVLSQDQTYSRLIATYAGRYNMKPGITGWAQVNGLRGETAQIQSMRRRVEYDLSYIQLWSLWTDIKILLLTVRELAAPRNAY